MYLHSKYERNGVENGLQSFYKVYLKFTEVCRSLLRYAEDHWGMQKITGVCRRLLGYAEDYWVCRSLLRYAEDYWDMQKFTEVCRRLLHFEVEFVCLPAKTLVCSLEEP